MLHAFVRASLGDAVSRWVDMSGRTGQSLGPPNGGCIKNNIIFGPVVKGCTVLAHIPSVDGGIASCDNALSHEAMPPSTEGMWANTVQPFTTGPKIMLFLMQPPFGGPRDCPVLPDMSTHRDTASPNEALTNACSKLPVIFLSG